MQLFQVIRFDYSDFDTVGLLFRDQHEFMCFTLEDPPQHRKIPGRTRIPAGTYELTLRKEGGFHSRYSNKFRSMHQGMIWVRNVPNYEYILMHIGNTHVDTDGCLLVGLGLTHLAGKPSALTQSTEAYKQVYPVIRDAIMAGPTYLQYVNLK